MLYVTYLTATNNQFNTMEHPNLTWGAPIFLFSQKNCTNLIHGVLTRYTLIFNEIYLFIYQTKSLKKILQFTILG